MPVSTQEPAPSGTPASDLIALLEGAGVGLCLVGPDLRVRRANAVWLRDVRLTAEQATGRSLLDLFPQSAAAAIEAHTRARSGERVAIPRHRADVDDTEQWWESVVTATDLPDGAGTIIAALNVTEQVLAERERERQAVEREARLAAQSALTAGQLEAVFEALTDPVVIFDATGQIVRLNSAARAVYGFNPIGRDRSRLLSRFNMRHPDGRAIERAELPSVRALHGEPVYNVPFIITTAAGEERYVVASAAPLIVDGSVQGAVASWHDMTDHRELLEQVQRERAFLHTVLNQLPAGVIIVEAPGGRPLMANPQVALMWRQDFAGAGGFAEPGRYRAFHADGRPFAPGDWPLARALRHGETISSEEIAAERGDGTPAVFQVSAGPVRDDAGNIIAAVAAFVDVTERKATEAALRASQEQLAELLARELEARAGAEQLNERLRLLSQSAHDYTAASLDQRAVLETVARRVAILFADTCVIRLLSDDGQFLLPAVVDHVDPAIRELVQPVLTASPQPVSAPPHGQVVATGEPLLQQVTSQQELRDASDPAYHSILDRLEVRSVAIVPLSVRGRVIGTVSASRYAPRPQHTQDEVMFLQALADHAALAVDNARLFREAQEAVRIRDEFLETAAHDLKNPLTAMKGLAQLLQRRAMRIAMPEGERERMQQGLTGIEVNVTRMGAQLEEFVDVARLQMGRTLTLNRQATDLVALAYQTAAVHQQSAERQRLWVHAAAPELIGWWDAVRIGRVLDNLLSNALKYSPGNAEVTVTLTRQLADGREWAVLEVEDHGIGIPPADLPAIFERFHRASNVAGNVAGTGLGLAGARQIVEQHGGAIDVASTEGVGTTVTVRLPLGLPVS